MSRKCLNRRAARLSCDAFRKAGPFVAAGVASMPTLARASFLSGEALDSAANVLAWVVICIVPIIGIVVFWMVHVLPEKIAHKRHHPQTQAIQTLCLLSLVFGGLLWPIAWLWAYTKPVLHKAAYGSDKHEDYFLSAGERIRAGSLVSTELAEVATEIEHLALRGPLPPHLAKLHDEIRAAQSAAETQDVLPGADQPEPAPSRSA